jgi:SAM-dependent methyltransferase
MSAKPTPRKKKTAPSKPRSPGKRSGLTLEVPPPDAAEDGQVAAAADAMAEPAEAEDVAVHMTPPDLRAGQPLAAAVEIPTEPPEIGTALATEEDLPPVAAAADPEGMMVTQTESAPSDESATTVEPAAMAPPVAGKTLDFGTRTTQSAVSTPAQIDLWLQRLGRTLPIHDWAFSALRSLSARQKLLGAIDLLLPSAGRILEVGCGAGLTAAYLAGSAPERHIVALHPQGALLRRGQRLADQLGLSNVSFVLGEALDASIGEGFDAIYAIDSLHRIAPSQLIPTLRRLASLLRPGGTLLIKEISSASYIGPGLTQLLERVLQSDEGEGPPPASAYRHHDEWLRLLRDVGLQARLGPVPDLLQSHILLTATRPPRPTGASEA